MLMRIDRSEVRLGMYVQALEGSWVSHPFWRKRFLLTDPADLAALQASTVSGVWIDAARGGAPVARPAAPEAGDSPGAPDGGPDRRARPAAAVFRPDRAQRSTIEELRHAAKTIARSKKVVRSLFEQARFGGLPDTSDVIEVVDEISASVARNRSALVSVARLKSKDEYTYMHSVAVCALMVNLARQLDLDAATTREAGIAGLLHDIGKMAIPDAVLNKPGRLSDAEFALIRTHPERGHALLAGAAALPEAARDVCLHHHEKVDGTGYPDRLAGEGIGLLARMGAICDVYDAVSSNRPYKKAWTAAEALSAMFATTGHFDGALMAAFVRSVGVYPVGTLVRLNSGRLGVVIEQNDEDLTKPVVRTFFCTRFRVEAPIRDVATAEREDAIVGREDPEAWGFADWDALWTRLMGMKAER